VGVTVDDAALFSLASLQWRPTSSAVSSNVIEERLHDGGRSVTELTVSAVGCPGLERAPSNLVLVLLLLSNVVIVVDGVAVYIIKRWKELKVLLSSTPQRVL
jgi:hypothetical protein